MSEAMSTASKKSPRVFVRYANRKMHELGDERPYVTMSKLLSIVAAGDPVKITDDNTGEDMTALVLARLVYDHSRMNKDAYTPEQLQKLIMSSPPETADQ